MDRSPLIRESVAPLSHEADNSPRSKPARVPHAPRPISQFMSTSPHVIGRDQSIETAHAIMRKYAIRHLPVLDGGKLAGVISQRELYLVEARGDIDTRSAIVGEEMSRETCRVQLDTQLEHVALDMAHHKYDCAVVMDGERVVGIFTPIDALLALASLARSIDSND